MNVRKRARKPDPGYPSQSQFSAHKRLLGVAAIGLSAMAGWATPPRLGGVPVPVRLGGEPAIEPRQTTSSVGASASTTGPAERRRFPGAIAVDPGPPTGASHAVSNQAKTDLPARTVYVVRKGDTLSALSLRFLGRSSRWRELAAANPGVTPETLKEGQTIVIPATPAADATEPLRLKGKMPAPRE